MAEFTPIVWLSNEKGTKIFPYRLVMCKECKYYPYKKRYADNKMYDTAYPQCWDMKEDDFCSKGELNEHNT